LERQRAEQERRQREEDARREADEEDRRQRELAEQQERQRQQELQRQRQRQQEAAEAAAAEAARTEYELVQSATALIQQVVQENWSRPPSARNGMRAVLQIRMLPTGELVDATITQSSGDPAFDRSAETAVFRAAPFSELQDLPINVFNTNFRSLSLIFEPEDLLN
jgi:colicin import membrane protein